MRNISNSCYKDRAQNEKALQTQIYKYDRGCPGAYNSTGTQQDEIDEKVFISHSKKSFGKTNTQLTKTNCNLNPDIVNASQSGNIPECFLKMECDQSIDEK